MAVSRPEATQPITLDAFSALPESDRVLYEVDEGRLVREPRPGRPHGTAVVLIGHALTAYALERGGIVTAETGYVLAEDPLTLRGPDVAYCRRDPAPYGDRDGFITGAPDLAVEVVSPSNRAADVRRAIAQYFRAGAAEVWIVYPAARAVEIHSPGGHTRSLGDDDTITSDALPDLRLPGADIFRF